MISVLCKSIYKTIKWNIKVKIRYTRRKREKKIISRITRRRGKEEKHIEYCMITWNMTNV